MARPKKIVHIEEIIPRSAYEKKMQEMRTGRIDKEYLTRLVMDYKFRKNIDKSFPMPRELGEVVLIIIDKMLGGSSWRNYTDDWKEEFRGRAIEHVLRYAHNFDPEKMKIGKNDPYNYFAMIITNAFIQSLRKCKQYADSKVVINEDILYNVTSWDEIYNMTPDMFESQSGMDITE
jgi:hypothetical protein